MLDYRNIEITEEIFNSPEYTEYRKERVKCLNNCCVYVIHNKINDHIYIGSSVNYKKRFIEHRRTLRRNTHHNVHLQRAWNKYGEDNFEFSPLEFVAFPDELRKREKSRIILYKANYNLAKVDVNGRFYCSEETKEKMRLKRLGTKLSNETKAKIGKASRGRKWTEESRKKWKETKKTNSYKHPQEVIDKITLKIKGKIRSPETLKRMSDCQKGHKQSKESIDKMIATRKSLNKPWTEESSRRLSNARRGLKFPNAKKPNARKVIDIRTNKIFNSICEAARENNILSSNLNSRLNGKIKAHKYLKLYVDV